MYQKILKPLLFKLNPEKAHRLTFDLLHFPFSKKILGNIYNLEDIRLEREVFGLKFKNPVGLAAGLDKNAEHIDELAAVGFGFIEIGTVTPKPQPGNPQPRLFRLKKDKALINRMGFNNDGVEKIAERLKKRKSDVIVGGNIGKNKDTPNEMAIEDYTLCFNALFDYVDYFVVNVSSPNTPGLRDLQEKEPLKRILNQLQQLNIPKPSPKPILLKIAPDLTDAQLDDIIEIVTETKIAGIIATNTTINRKNLKTSQKKISAIGAGGLSGKPLRTRSTEVIRYLHQKSGGAFPIIGVGGIHTREDAMEKLEAGASLIQLYTGFIYEGPGLVKEIKKKLLENKPPD